MLYHLDGRCSHSRGRALADAERVLDAQRRALSRRRRGLPLEPVARRGARARAASTTLVPLRHALHRGLRDAGLRLPEARAATDGPAFLLESAEQGQRVGRWSFIGVRPRVGRCAGSRGRRRRPATRIGAPTRGRSRCRRRRRCPATCRRSPAARSGFFGYDLVRTVEPLGEPNPDPLGLPDMALMITDALVVFDHLKHTISILANVFADDGADVDAAYAEAAATIAEVRERLAGPGAARRRGGRARAPRSPRVRPRT